MAALHLGRALVHVTPINIIKKKGEKLYTRIYHIKVLPPTPPLVSSIDNGYDCWGKMQAIKKRGLIQPRICVWKKEGKISAYEFVARGRNREAGVQKRKWRRKLGLEFLFSYELQRLTMLSCTSGANAPLIEGNKVNSVVKGQ